MTASETPEPATLARQKINLETAEIAWLELQRHFAAGRLVVVKPGEDLVEVAYQISEDNTAQVAKWREAGVLDAVSDAQAQVWHTENAHFWAVVVRPWVLVQPIESPPG